MQKKGLVSICIPTYNRTELLTLMLDSILEQTYQNFEIIITDNSENNLTKELISSKYRNNRIKYFKNETNLGMGGNSCRAFSFVSGEFFTFTADDDVWNDKKKLEIQVKLLQANSKINITYSNAISIDYSGSHLPEFTSIYGGSAKNCILSAAELLPGYKTQYFLNILTALLRTETLLEIFKQSFRFNSEEYLCFYIAATDEEISFSFDKFVALRETEHYRTAIENGKLIDWKKRKDYRIKLIFSIYTTLTHLYPKTLQKLETPMVHSCLGNHVISQAWSSRNIPLLLKTISTSSLIFSYFSFFNFIKVKITSKFKKTKTHKSFG